MAEEKKLKKLGDHNAEMMARHNDRVAHKATGKPNGIACPMCKKELNDTNPGIVLTTDPPQKDVNCPACGWTGHRFC